MRLLRLERLHEPLHRISSTAVSRSASANVVSRRSRSLRSCDSLVSRSSRSSAPSSPSRAALCAAASALISSSTRARDADLGLLRRLAVRAPLRLVQQVALALRVLLRHHNHRLVPRPGSGAPRPPPPLRAAPPPRSQCRRTAARVLGIVATIMAHPSLL